MAKRDPSENRIISGFGHPPPPHILSQTNIWPHTHTRTRLHKKVWDKLPDMINGGKLDWSFSCKLKKLYDSSDAEKNCESSLRIFCCTHYWTRLVIPALKWKMSSITNLKNVIYYPYSRKKISFKNSSILINLLTFKPISWHWKWQWLWLNWWTSQLWCQRSTVQIPPSVEFSSSTSWVENNQKKKFCISSKVPKVLLLKFCRWMKFARIRLQWISIFQSNNVNYQIYLNSSKMTYCQFF